MFQLKLNEVAPEVGAPAVTSRGECGQTQPSSASLSALRMVSYECLGVKGKPSNNSISEAKRKNKNTENTEGSLTVQFNVKLNM